ncbi:MAG: hypothetical protein A2365_02050 [Candidatus Nealsonbacteria bacterium RIFOXYB1_FULL_40_15]|uniref:Uncharacterized protein n=2 Tax=Candidatus Nealsoniibacteriota TaxID=1817911 RepID=A0A1G2ER03_9BACT|nr:MAG: hypothetical protein A2365_02050 [Candidatus Nealsonbacteria bacterium RIFOXYB1_FULL_40_15]OGZ28223.1 MAG: hypothetical protein A2427_02620 [Candidatus Nealsonbacteria bacterium RIFOXYC1_FULL_40_7]OGZ28989.1 MAG: hypothetical protein A2562_01775 [Candidatus Nealsonbacteria bacterium RIFOXYD1_FULL_39_11]
MNLLKYLIPIALVIIGLFLIKYDRNKELKNRHIAWLSRYLFRDSSGVNASAARLHQTILGFLFIFCVGIGVLFIVGLLEG